MSARSEANTSSRATPSAWRGPVATTSASAGAGTPSRSVTPAANASERSQESMLPSGPPRRTK